MSKNEFIYWIRSTFPDANVYEIPREDDLVRDSSDEALVEMYRRAFDEMASNMAVENVVEMLTIARACEQELVRREKGHLLAGVVSKS
jgi:hypothetical protein